jgi:hypothetical protein
MADENATWGCRRIQGALANLGHHIDAITVRDILRRHHREPAPQRRKAGMSWAQFLRLRWEVLKATDFLTVMVVARLHPSGRGACASRIASMLSMVSYGGQALCHDLHGGSFASSYGAAV